MNAGRPRGSSGCSRFPATSAYGVSGASSRTARQASTGSPSFAHSRASPRWSWTTARVGVQLRELLEPVERAVRPLGEGGADLRLERVVAREHGGRGRGVSPPVESGALREVARLGIRAEAERERERRPTRAELRRGRGRRRSGAAAGGENGRGRDTRRRERDRSDEERDATPGGHRRTVTGPPKL